VGKNVADADNIVFQNGKYQ